MSSLNDTAVHVRLGTRRTFLLASIVAGALCIGLPGSARAQSYTFTTLAGLALQSGSANGTNSGARFYKPGGVAVDGGGNLYVADTSNHTIRKVAHSGTNWVVTTVAGLAGAIGTNDGPGSASRFYYPYGVAVDAATNLYVADAYNHTIRKITPTDGNWVVSTLAGTPKVFGSQDGAGSTAQFHYPYGVAVDNSGSVFVADTYNYTIRLITSDGNVSTPVGLAGAHGTVGGTNNAARFYYPYGVSVDSSGNLYVADSYNCTVRKVTPMGSDWVVTTLAGVATFSGSADGTNSGAQFSYEFGLSADSTGDLYVADTSNDTIRKMVPLGTDWVVSTIGGTAQVAGHADGPGGAATFNYPRSVAVDSAGNLYIADANNHTIRFGFVAYSLQAARIGKQLVLSWPVAATDFILETSSRLGAQASWSPLTTGVFLSGTNYVRTNSIGSGAAFFRLHKLDQSAGYILLAAHMGNQLVLSWSASATNFLLETSSTLDPSASWSPLTTGIVLSGPTFVRTNSVGPGAAFFRLHQQ